MRSAALSRRWYHPSVEFLLFSSILFSFSHFRAAHTALGALSYPAHCLLFHAPQRLR